MAGDLILLTGATGMIGFKTLTLLLQEGYVVRAAVRNQAGFDRISSLGPVAKFKAQLSSVIVPEITVPGAYDEAVRGVKYIVHAASPLPGSTQGADYQATLIQPAVEGTVGILKSAAKTTGIERVVITASVSSIVSNERVRSGVMFDENTLDTDTKGPLNDEVYAYFASKALAHAAVKDFMQTAKPSFNVINVLPAYVVGRDETVTDASAIAKGSNGLVMGPLLGYPRDYPIGGRTVHLDDGAKMHVLSLEPKVEGNQDFLAAAEGIEWADSFEIVKRRYPKAYAEGVFKFESISKPVTTTANVDAGKATRVLGVEFKGFEEQVVSVVDHFLELAAQ
ncbi:hypothetical protein QQS21_010412 [Conoideocrella luteorostrata]|uniref:NAD-dependent epimerase/dehydratase domain-containing protein n=1 Tax=Conoideocrella luteorostrata TaxID=1105319 RepID=A0AAJ0CHD9_9HYPO|nr:hypothetical protein QQS21_010412 [Conoideocrella luteorostrata]